MNVTNWIFMNASYCKIIICVPVMVNYDSDLTGNRQVCAVDWESMDL